MSHETVHWCPRGHGAFEAGAVRCPRCGERLVDRPVPRAGHDDEPQTVAIAPNEAIAALWKSMLEANGIVTMIRPLGPGFGAWASVATFEHEVVVRHADADLARAILNEDENPGPDRPVDSSRADDA